MWHKEEDRGKGPRRKWTDMETDVPRTCRLETGLKRKGTKALTRALKKE